VYDRFVTDVRYHLLNDDELSLGPSGSAQMFQYFEAILVSPVMKYSGKEDDGNVLLLCRLWVKKVVAFGEEPECQRANPGRSQRGERSTLNFYTAGFETIGHVLLPELWSSILSGTYL
jgi:hypothetical protein